MKWRAAGQDETSGFTLIETLVVVVITGVISSIVVIGVMNASATSASTACRSDLHTVETALLAYRAQMGNYPDGTTSGGTGLQTDTDATTVNAASRSSGGGSELLQPSSWSATDPNETMTPSVGPWLRDVPSNGSHYAIVVANDGSGTVTVNDAAGSGQLDCRGVA